MYIAHENMESSLVLAAGSSTSRQTWSGRRPEPLSRERGSDDPWSRYMHIIRRLYIDEHRPLNQVREIMEQQHGFTASQKMYKRRFIAWGWRKNIRTAGEATDRILEAAKADLTENARVSLPNGQVIDARRLALHLARKQGYLKLVRQRHEQSWVDLPSVQSFESPSIFRAFEAAFYYTKAYVKGRYEGVITAEEIEDSRLGLGKRPGVEWNIFAGNVGQLVEHEKINEALVLMRTAPAEMAALLQSPPTNIVSLICMLVAHVSGRRKTKEAMEHKQISQVLKALLRYGSTIAVENKDRNPAFQALSGVLRSLSAVEDEHLVHACVRTWKLDCQTWDTMVPGCTSQVVDWLIFADEVGMQNLPFDDPESLFRERLQYFEGRYGQYDHRCIEVLSLLLFYVIGSRAKTGLDPFDNTALGLCEDILRRKPQKASHRIITSRFAAEGYRRRGDLNQVETYMQSCVDAIREDRGDQSPDDMKVAWCLEESIWKTGDRWRLLRYPVFQ